jgi:hypothetical protein
MNLLVRGAMHAVVRILQVEIAQDDRMIADMEYQDNEGTN